MSGDLRGFIYALEPLLRQRRWRVNAAQARLGRLQREINEVVQEMRRLSEAHRIESEAATRAFRHVADSDAHARRLHWLVQMQDRRAALEKRLQTLREERRALRAECMQEQRALDAVQSHRDNAAQEHLREDGARLAREADRNWLVHVALTEGPLA